MPAVVLRTVPTADLSTAGLQEVRALLHDSFGGRFDDEDWSHALGGLHVLATVDGELAGHAAVVARSLIADDVPLRTGYVEADATEPRRRRKGVAGTVMAEVERLVTGGWELGALASSAEGTALYTARGWLPWRGALAALTPAGIVETPGEVVFVLPTPGTPASLDTAGRLVCEWRRGDPW